MTRYEQGFMRKCASFGVNPMRAAQLYGMRKQALSNAAIGGIGAGAGALLGAGAGALVGTGDGEDSRRKRLRNILVGALLGGGIGGGLGYGFTPAKNYIQGRKVRPQIEAGVTGGGFGGGTDISKTLGTGVRTGTISKDVADKALARELYIRQALADYENPYQVQSGFRDALNGAVNPFGLFGRWAPFDRNRRTLTPELRAQKADEFGKEWDAANGAISLDQKPAAK